jgi:hypothetical protein
MPYQEFQENWKKFSTLIEQLPTTDNEEINIFIKRYIDQNLMIFNEIFSTSIDYLKKLQNAKSTTDVICTHAKFTHQVSNKLSLSAQCFLDASLGKATDHNEWLKAHCDLATD